RDRQARAPGRRAVRTQCRETRDFERVLVDVLAVLATDEVPASRVVHITVVVVVESVAGGLLGIEPEVRLERGVRRVDAAVDDGDGDDALRLTILEQLAFGAQITDAGEAIRRGIEQVPVE